MNNLTIDLSLRNIVLYTGCSVEEVAGRANLITPPEEAANIIGKNINNYISSLDRRDLESVTLTGAMAVWAYLVVFHAVVHAFREIWYDDGRNSPVLLAKHG